MLSFCVFSRVNYSVDKIYYLIATHAKNAKNERNTAIFMATYDLSKSEERVKFFKRAKFFWRNGRFVELREPKAIRTLEQNRYLHLLLQCFALEYHDTLEYIKEEYYKKICNRDLFVYYKYDELKGCKTERTKSSRELTREEMSLSIDRFKNYAAQNGIFLPDADKPDEIIYAMQQVERYAEYI